MYIDVRLDKFHSCDFIILKSTVLDLYNYGNSHERQQLPVV